MTSSPTTTRPRDTRRAMLLRAVALLGLAAGCATTSSGTPVPMSQPAGELAPGAAFAPIGELVFSDGRGAAYDAYRVQGPRVNMTYASNGAWSGLLDGRNVMVTAAAGKITGAGGTLYVNREGDQLTIRGQWMQRSISLVVSAAALKGRTGEVGPSFDFTRTARNVMSGQMGVGRGGVELRGEAQQVPEVAMPQFVLALLATLP